MRSPRKLALIVLLTALLSAWSVGPVAAAPIEMRRDRSDNTMYFQYDALSGRMLSAYSSRVIRRKDRIDFFAYVAERQGASPGSRLRGRIVVRLNRDRPVRYHGRFAIVVQDATGATAFKGTEDVAFILRPRKGQRHRYLRWFFDLPTGDYTVFARFLAT